MYCWLWPTVFERTLVSSGNWHDALHLHSQGLAFTIRFFASSPPLTIQEKVYLSFIYKALGVTLTSDKHLLQQSLLILFQFIALTLMKGDKVV